MSAIAIKEIGMVHWVEAAVEMPDDEMTVLLALSNGETWVGYRLAGEWYLLAAEVTGTGEPIRVTHWADMPEHPVV